MGVKCSFCGGNSRKWITKNSHTLYKCKLCELVFVGEMPAEEELAKIYNKDYFLGWEKNYEINNDLREKAARCKKDIIFSNLKKHKLPYKKMKVLEIGAAMGHLLSQFKPHFQEVYGQDISPFAVREMAKRGINGTDKPISKLEGSYDLIIMSDVIEHLRDPEKALGEVYSLLNPKGVLYLTTPNIKSIQTIVQGKNRQIITPPEHLYYFNQRSLRLMLYSVGYSNIKILPSSRDYKHPFLSLFSLFKKAIPCSGKIEKNIHIINENRGTGPYEIVCYGLGYIGWFFGYSDHVTAIATRS